MGDMIPRVGALSRIAEFWSALGGFESRTVRIRAALAAPLDRVTDASRLGLLESERVRLSTVSRARCHGPEHGVLSHVARERLQLG